MIIGLHSKAWRMMRLLWRKSVNWVLRSMQKHRWRMPFIPRKWAIIPLTSWLLTPTIYMPVYGETGICLIRDTLALTDGRAAGHQHPPLAFFLHAICKLWEWKGDIFGEPSSFFRLQSPRLQQINSDVYLCVCVNQVKAFLDAQGNVTDLTNRIFLYDALANYYQSLQRRWSK